MKIIYYHKADNDGKASGAITYRALTGKDSISLRGIDYGDYDFQEEYDSWGDEDEVYLVDFSFQGEGHMKKAFEKLGDRFIFIDHHKTAIEEIEGLDIRGLREEGTAACRLCWRYFFPDSPEPEAIKLIGMYDVWDLNPKVERFQLGVSHFDLDPTSQTWVTLFASPTNWIDDVVKGGAIIEKYLTLKYMENAKKCAFEIRFDDYIAVCLNEKNGSKPFDSVFNAFKHDFMLSFYKLGKGDIWSMSFYSIEGGVDVSEIAKKYGGGGHRGAAGCEVTSKELLEIIGEHNEISD